MMMGISIKEENASLFFVSFSVFISIISIIISITITRNGLFSLSLSLYASITLLPSSLPKRLRLRLRRLKFVKWKTRTRRPRRGITPPRTRF